MKRRAFLSLIGVAAASCASWPLAARAQQGERVRRIGVLMNVGESDPQGRARLGAFVQRLTELGWIEGRNTHLDIRWGAGDAERFRQYAAELVTLMPDVILANASATVAHCDRSLAVCRSCSRG
jgi:putative ABC transport system substrate-binding protein